MTMQGVPMIDAPDLTSIRRIQVVADGQADIVFDALPQHFAALRLHFSGRGTTGAQSTNLRMQFNDDVGANYNYQNLFAGSTTVSASLASAQSQLLVGDLTAASATANFATTGEIVLPNYAMGTFFRGFHSRLLLVSSTVQINTHAGWWASTAAVQRIRLFPAAGGFAAGTIVTLHGFV